MHQDQNQHADFSFYISRQKEIEGLFEEDIFKVITSNKVVAPKKIPNSKKVFNSCFYVYIRDPYINKARKKCHLVIHIYNYKKKNIMLKHSSKIPGVSQGLRDIIQTYVEIASNLNPDFYIQPLFKLISQQSASFNSILEVMRLLYE